MHGIAKGILANEGPRSSWTTHCSCKSKTPHILFPDTNWLGPIACRCLRLNEYLTVRNGLQTRQRILADQFAT